MRLAFLLYKYFPFGGLQRDFLRIALECQRRGHAVRVYCLSWEGEVPEGFEVRHVPVRALSNHRRNQKYIDWVHADLARDPVDRVVGFNKMPGLDVYYAADGCYAAKAAERGWWSRIGGRYRHFSETERAVFAPESHTQIMLIAEDQRRQFIQHYQVQSGRLHMLPPGIAVDRRAPSNAKGIRSGLRHEFGIAEAELLLIQIGSGFKTKGLDRSLRALAALPESIRLRTRMLIIGQDNPRKFLALSSSLGVADRVTFLQGRNDVPRFLLGADLMVHPAYHESAGAVLLEALVAGLPVLATDVCGYAHYIAQANGGRVLPSPFEQTQLNEWLLEALTDVEQRAAWSRNALAWAETANIYSMPQYAADIILAQRP